MNIVRALDQNGDWTFGLGVSGYLAGKAMINQNIETRLLEQLGDCFFNLGAGLDQNLYSQKNILALDLAIRGIILNTSGVTGLVALPSRLSESRVASFTYRIVTIYGTLVSTYTYSIPQGSP